MTTDLISQDYIHFLEDLKSRVSTSRYHAALSVNSEIILLYHHIGTQIIKSQEQYGWGAKVISQLSQDLRSAFPDMKGFSTTNLKYMKMFAAEYMYEEIGQQAVDQLPWGHTIALIHQVSDKNDRQFYIQQAIENGWSRNVLPIQIETKLHKRQEQLNFYLAAIDGEVKHESDNPSIGLLLCKDKGNHITAEYSLRNMASPIGVASYIPKELEDILPSIEQIESKLNRLL